VIAGKKLSTNKEFGNEIDINQHENETKYTKEPSVSQFEGQNRP